MISSTRWGLLAALFSVWAGQALPEDVQAQQKLKECGACHMIFPPQMLPAKSWERILGEMDNHFGERASIPPETLAEIRSYLISHAADAPDTPAQYRHYLSETQPDAVPTRITTTAWWTQMHADFDFSGVGHSSVRSPANCLACHPAGFE